jgi:hypothetical protein
MIVIQAVLFSRFEIFNEGSSGSVSVPDSRLRRTGDSRTNGYGPSTVVTFTCNEKVVVSPARVNRISLGSKPASAASAPTASMVTTGVG